MKCWEHGSPKLLYRPQNSHKQTLHRDVESHVALIYAIVTGKVMVSLWFLLNKLHWKVLVILLGTRLLLRYFN